MKPSVGTVGRWPLVWALGLRRCHFDELVLAEQTRLGDAKATAGTSSWPPSLLGADGPHLEGGAAVANDLVSEFPLRERPSGWSCERRTRWGGAKPEALPLCRPARPAPGGLGIDPSPRRGPARPGAGPGRVTRGARSPEHRRITTAIPVPASETIGRGRGTAPGGGGRRATGCSPPSVRAGGQESVAAMNLAEVSGELVYVDLSGLTQACAQAAAICIEYPQAAGGPDLVATLSAALTWPTTVLVDGRSGRPRPWRRSRGCSWSSAPGVSMVITPRAPRWGAGANRFKFVELLDQGSQSGARQVPLPGPSAVRLLR